MFKFDLQLFAHKKGLGSSKNGRDSASQRLGIKIFGDEKVKAGNILVRQRGTKFRAGLNTGIGTDHTIFATVDGIVRFYTRRGNQFITVVPSKA